MLLQAPPRPRRPLRPSQDPFHDAPQDLEELAPGEIIRTRRVRLAFLGLIPQVGLKASQIAYRSNDLNGVAEVAVTTVVAPKGTPVGLIGYQCAIDAVADRCFPSYSLRLGAFALGALPQGELIFIAALLARGYAVSIADHEGRGGYFAAPREPGHRVLDGLRAVRAFDPVDVDETTPIGLIGYSGGGMATSWAAEVAPAYAPELPIVGAVLGSPVGDPGEAFLKLNDGLYAGLPALVVSGLRDIYPGLDAVVEEHASDEGRARLDALRGMTTVGAVVKYAYDDFDDYLDAPLADVLAMRPVLEVFDDLRLGQHAPTCPLLVLHANHDQIIDVIDVDAQVERYERLGVRVEYVRDRASEHITLMVLGMPLMLHWLEDRFAGLSLGESRVVTSVALSRRAWQGYAGLIGSVLRVVTGRVG